MKNVSERENEKGRAQRPGLQSVCDNCTPQKAARTLPSIFLASGSSAAAMK